MSGHNRKYSILENLPEIGDLVFIIDYDKSVHAYTVVGFKYKKPRRDKKDIIYLWSGSYYCFAYLFQIYELNSSFKSADIKTF